MVCVRVLISAILSTALAIHPSALASATQAIAPSPDQPGSEAPPAAPLPDVSPANSAEQIARLSASIAEDTRRLEQLKAELDTARNEVDRANASFEEADTKHREATAELERRRLAEEPIEELQTELQSLTTTRALAAERRELAATAWKTLTEQIATLEMKLRQNDQALKKLLGNEAATAAPTADAPTPERSTASPPSPSSEPGAVESPPSAAIAQEAESIEAPTNEAALPPAPAPTAAEVASPTPAPTGIPTLPGLPSSGAITSTPIRFGPDPNDPKLKQARATAQSLADAVDRAKNEVAELTERLGTIDKLLHQEEQARDTARRLIDNAEATGAELAREFQQKLFAGAPSEEQQEQHAAELRDLQTKIRENEKRLIQARGEAREHGDEILRLQSERGDLAAQLQLARWRAEQANARLAEAESVVQRLENPFSPENLLNWLLDHGLKILGIILGMLLLRWGSGLVSRRIVTLLSARGQRGSTAEKEHRISTLVGVFDNAASVAIVVGGILMVFQEVGVPVGPLLGGAAVFGLAIAFGAQNLIRDYFYGFVILLENQYKLNDVIKIRNIAGQVEAITLRVTVLRDLEGCVHFIPNGEITSVTNMTHGWSRALFEIGVAYKENVDRVMDVILEVGKELRKDPQFRMLMLEDPTMLGVDAFADSAVMIKFFIKTRPLQQWVVKRELLRRLKNRFDELGIEIPFPHRTVYHVHPEGHTRELADSHLSGDEVIVAGRAGPGASVGR
ncbi:mechanosensitive ion channel domain-containing protein [Tautonia sociabilis]|uniref:Mechanosensitive ion channel n=1 Tax=Tautonia sociabilis TaxID=2080755 RepID=A0A432MJJ9_9BACT|nr:mechanosensitive ion channel domain-containing protein [Tautonia sociabilis]RUL87571.1 mechanosensitive ion channel [Tautonia sociabilis]